jgi:LysR family nitrogen assimilation transcriptional regulator
MDIRQLRYFIAITEAGSFSRAAQQLHVAQPALSQHILAMEAAFGVKLLQRNARGVTVTEAGQRLLGRARYIDAAFSDLTDHVRGAAIPTGKVRFGMPGTINEQLGVPLIETCRRDYPEVKVRVSEAMSGFVLDWLRDGSIDLALLYGTEDQKGLHLHHALTEEIVLFGIKGLKGSPKSNTISLSSALQLPLILPGEAHGLRSLIDMAANTIGKTVEPDIEIDSYRQIKSLALRGGGFAMLPATAVKQEITAGVFESWHVIEPELERKIYLGYQSGRPMSAASRAVAQLSWDILQQLVKTGAWTATWSQSGVIGDILI